MDNLSFNAQQLATLTQIGSFQGKHALYGEKLPAILNTMRKIAQVESTESSNRIEGIVASRKRIQGIVLENTNPTNRPEQEIAGYRDTLAIIHESAREMAFSPSVIRQLHSTMYRYLPQPGGTWKPVDNEIVERQSDGSLSVRFRPVSAVATPQAMMDLSQGFERAFLVEERPGLLVGPLAILYFLCIHPFADGNGRISRLLTLQLLYKMDYQVGGFSAWRGSLRNPKKRILRHWIEVPRDGTKGVMTLIPGWPNDETFCVVGIAIRVSRCQPSYD